MAVCNLLMKELSSSTGNFLLFSQYAEDITRNFTEDNNYKVVPTKFIALDINFSDNSLYKHIKPYSDEYTNANLNTLVPLYFQDHFENSCAYCRTHETELVHGNVGGGSGDKGWTPEVFKNLFWNSMFDANFLTITSNSADSITYLNELRYVGDINMHSYNDHSNMGYSEIYCYIPSDAKQMRMPIDKSDPDITRDELDCNTGYLEGWESSKIKRNYSHSYYYGRDYDVKIGEAKPIEDNAIEKYSINTIVVLYSVYHKDDNNWTTQYENIPMGIYFAGKHDGNTGNSTLTNAITKYINTSYNTGTAYGLRICTRFAVNPENGVIQQTSEGHSDHDCVDMCQLMTAMHANLQMMNKVTANSINTINAIKDTLSIITNSRTNVPYVRTINGIDYWFVNGKLVSRVDNGKTLLYGAYTNDQLTEYIATLNDGDETNDQEVLDQIHADLAKQFTEEEIKAALEAIKNEKQ